MLGMYRARSLGLSEFTLSNINTLDEMGLIQGCPPVDHTQLETNSLLDTQGKKKKKTDSNLVFEPNNLIELDKQNTENKFTFTTTRFTEHLLYARSVFEVHRFVGFKTFI